MVLVGNRHITLFAFEVFSVQLGQEWYFHISPVLFIIASKEYSSKEQIFGQTCRI